MEPVGYYHLETIIGGLTKAEFGHLLHAAYRMESLQSAGVTYSISAVRSSYSLKSPLILLPQEGCVHSNVDMVPRKDFVCISKAVGVETWIESCFAEGLEPFVVIKVFAPGIEGASELPCTVEDSAESSVAAG